MTSMTIGFIPLRTAEGRHDSGTRMPQLRRILSATPISLEALAAPRLTGEACLGTLFA